MEDMNGRREVSRTAISRRESICGSKTDIQLVTGAQSITRWPTLFNGLIKSLDRDKPFRSISQHLKRCTSVVVRSQDPDVTRGSRCKSVTTIERVDDRNMAKDTTSVSLIAIDGD